MSTSSTYHHGDLRAALVRAALEILQRPALFRVMFGEPCDRDSAERVAATAAISAYVGAIVQRAFPGADPETMSTAIWALVHGLAFLHLDGKLDTSAPDAAAGRVRVAVHAVLSATAPVSAG